MGHLPAPERSLLLAVLKRALFDYFGNNSIRKEDAERWLFGNEDAADLFSFNWVCTALGFNPVFVLRRIRSFNPRNSRDARMAWVQFCQS
jgi:hypothetical protein